MNTNDSVSGSETKPSPADTKKSKPVRGPGPIGLFREMPILAKLGALWLAFIVLGAIYAKIDDLLGQALPLQDPSYQPRFGGGVDRTEAPSLSHWLGTDVLRRDTFARIIHGGWVSLIVASTAAIFGVVVGGFIGTFVGYIRGIPEMTIMSGIDVILAFPPLILLLAMVSVFNVRSLAVISLVIGFLSIPAYTRVARANTLAIAKREFVLAAEAIGTKKSTILFREIIPNVLPTLLAYAMVQAAFVIVVEGTLSFLGLSVQLPTATWGNMINEARGEIKQTILPVLWPSLALTFTVLSVNQVGDWLQKRGAYRSSGL